MKIIGLVILFIPIIWELYNDRNGDAHITRGIFSFLNVPSKKIDVVFRGFLAIVSAFITSYITGIHLGICLYGTIAIHLMFFDYIITYILIKKGIIQGHWVSYLGSNNTDKFVKNIPPYLRMLIRIVIFVVFLILYF